jgi:hypothetical protein
MDKVHGRRKQVNDAMSIGIHMEPWIMAKCRRVHPDWHVESSPGMYAASDDRDSAGNMWRAANPDGIATLPKGRRVLIEAKTAIRYGDLIEAEAGWGEEGTDEIPYSYLCQVIWTCAVLGLDWWIVAVLFLDSRQYAEYRGRFEPDLAATLSDRGRSWRNEHVIGGVEPAADGLESTRHILNDRFSAASEKKSYAAPDPDALLWQADYCRTRSQIKELDERRAGFANLLRQEHVRVDATELRVDGQTISTMTTTKAGSVRLTVKDPA